MTFLSILKLVVQLLPIVLECVKVAEANIPQSGQGASKFEFVKALLTDTVDISKEVNEKDYSDALDKTINLAVKLLNAAGIFKKGT